MLALRMFDEVGRAQSNSRVTRHAICSISDFMGVAAISTAPAWWGDK